MTFVLQCEVLAIAYLVVDEASILGSLSVMEKVIIRTVAYLSSMIVHQIERISRELGASSAFPLYQEAVVRTWE